MKQIQSLALIGTLALLGCGFHEANAQTAMVSVGNPDSENMMSVEEEYQIIVPIDNPQPQPADNIQDWSKEGNVEVAPQPQNPPATQEETPAQPMGMSVNENIIETPTTIDVNEDVEEN